MSCPASAGAAETANGAEERMVLLGLTGAYYIKFRGPRFVVCEVGREGVTGMTKVLHIH